MSDFTGLSVRIVPLGDGPHPAGKVAHAEVCFGVTDTAVAACYRTRVPAAIDAVDALRLMDGLKIAEFGVWLRKPDQGKGFYVTRPRRSSASDQGRISRSYIVRPTGDDDRLGGRDIIRLSAYIAACYVEWLAAQPAVAHA